MKRLGESGLGRAGVFIALGAEVSGAVGASAFLGYYLDQWLETEPLFMLALVILGTVGAFWRVYRMAKHLEDRKDG